jgi:F0F1-type ATP synthase membrane subunit b/b'
MAIFKSLDSRRKQAVEARAAAVAQARQRAQQQIADAKAQLEKESAAARASLKTSSEKIAGQIIKTILASAGSATVVGGK